ncbi:MAG: hypothetical protein Q4G35_07440 [Propionibacteriaceae bacterium]|nr:hypothetical protein [Propionibacteriaceae bacterium]
MLRRTTLARWAIPATAALALGLAIPALSATADTSAAENCVQAGNVWVQAAYDETVKGACATEFATAQDALTASGLSADKGWVQTVDGRTAADPEWWSVYSLTPDANGSYKVDWDFAQVGVAELKMNPSSVLALQLQADWSKDSVAPAVNPLGGVTLTKKAAEPTATTAAPTRPGPPKTGR